MISHSGAIAWFVILNEKKKEHFSEMIELRLPELMMTIKKKKKKPVKVFNKLFN